jgi:hypothetical protein
MEEGMMGEGWVWRGVDVEGVDRWVETWVGGK